MVVYRLGQHLPGRWRNYNEYNGIGTLENALVHLAQSGRPWVAGTIFIPQSWSLSLEIWFYMLAPFIVRRHWSVILALFVASAALRVFLGQLVPTAFPNIPWDRADAFPSSCQLFLQARCPIMLTALSANAARTARTGWRAC